MSYFENINTNIIGNKISSNTYTISAIGNTDINISGLSTVMVQTINSGTSVGQSVEFMISCDGTNFVDWKGYNGTSATLSATTTGIGEAWNFDGLKGAIKFRVKVNALTSGSFTLIVNAVA